MKYCFSCQSRADVRVASARFLMKALDRVGPVASLGETARQLTITHGGSSFGEADGTVQNAGGVNIKRESDKALVSNDLYGVREPSTLSDGRIVRNSKASIDKRRFNISEQ